MLVSLLIDPNRLNLDVLVAFSRTGVRRCEHAGKCCCAHVLFVEVIEVVFINIIEVLVDLKVEPKRAQIEAWSDPKVDAAGHCK